MDRSFARNHHLKGKDLIAQVFNSGKGIKAYPILAIVIRTDDPILKAGFSVPKKKIRKAVDRNLIKRRMIEAFRINLPESQIGLNQNLALMLIFLDRQVADYETIDLAVKQVLKKIKGVFPSNVEQS